MSPSPRVKMKNAKPPSTSSVPYPTKASPKEMPIRRFRAKHWKDRETELFMCLILEYGRILFNKKYGKEINKQKEAAYIKIAEQYQARKESYMEPRPPQQLKAKWKNYQEVILKEPIGAQGEYAQKVRAILGSGPDGMLAASQVRKHLLQNRKTFSILKLTHLNSLRSIQVACLIWHRPLRSR